MTINTILDCKEIIQKINLSIILDNRVLGLTAHRILEALKGGVASGGGNQQLCWKSAEGVSYATGVGKIPVCFMKSQYKGVGRTLPENREDALKDGDRYMYLEMSKTGDSVLMTDYSSQDIIEMIA